MTASTIRTETLLSRYVALAPGTPIGRYEVIDVVGSGAMGMVYRARDPAMQRDVALKVLHGYQTQLEDAADHRRRLIHEARTLATLSHPNIVAVYDAGAHDRTVFIAMELVVGVSLQAWLAQPRPRSAITQVLLAVGRGVAAAHAAGILHRDLKPSNVMVGDDGRVRVVDFGLANEVIARDIIVGTPGYIAPEQLLGDPADEAGDQFGYAATAFQALAGAPRFTANGLEAYKLAVASGERTPWPERVPRRIRAVIERGLAARELRYPSVAAMVDALEAAAGPRRRLVLAGGLVATAAAAAAIAFAVTRPAGSSCEVPDDGLWSAPRHAALTRAFAATGVHHAAETAQLVATRLDQFVERWNALYDEACRGDLPAGALDDRYACLSRHRDRVRTFIALLDHPTAALVDRAGVTATDILDLDDCTASDREPDHSPEGLRITALLNAGTVLSRAGRWREAWPLVEPLTAAARTLGSPTLELEVLSLRAELEDALGERAKSTASLREGLELASRNHDRVRSAKFGVVLLQRLIQDATWTDATALLPVVTSQVHLANLPPLGKVVLLSSRATIEARTGDHTAARATLAEAAALCERAAGRRAACVLEVESTNAELALERDDLDAAAAAYARVVAMAREFRGRHHPSLVRDLNNLANARAEAGDHDGALAALAESHELARTMPPDAPQLDYLSFTEGWVWKLHGDCARAIPPLEAGRARLAAREGERANPVVVADQRIGECLLELNRPVEAIPYLERWSAARRHEEARPEWIAQADFSLARALWAVPAQRRRAVDLARRARAAFVAYGPGAAEETTEVAAWLAERCPTSSRPAACGGG